MIEDTIFSPSFGRRPNPLIGREKVINDFLSGISGMPGSKDRATIILGQRGMGKTVLLLELAEKAREKGMIVASPTVVSDDMLVRIVEKLQDEGESTLDKSKREVTGGSVGFLGFSAGLQFSKEGEEEKSFAYKLSKLVSALNEKGRGVLILIDEVQANSRELKQLVIAYQELVGEDRDVAIAMAGLPGAVSSTLNDHVLTFINRSNKVELEPLGEAEIDAFYLDSFEKLGVSITDKLRQKAVKATEGSPYMLQLLGHNITKYVSEDGVCDETRLDLAIKASRDEFVNDICQTTINSLSDTDIDFLINMLPDEGSSRISDIAARMGVKGDYAQQYKKRLIDSGIIRQSRRGMVDFDVPLIKEYLKQNY